MGLRIVSKTISWLQQLDGRMTWHMSQGQASGTDKKVYLTFDDGPIPDLINPAAQVIESEVYERRG